MLAGRTVRAASSCSRGADQEVQGRHPLASATRSPVPGLLADPAWWGGLELDPPRAPCPLHLLQRSTASRRTRFSSELGANGRPSISSSTSASSYGVFPRRPNCSRRYSASTARWSPRPARLSDSTTTPHVPHAPLGHERRAFPRGHPHRDGLLAKRRHGLHIRPHQLVEIRIVRAPYQVAAADPAGIQHAVAEAQLQRALPLRHLEEASALFGFLRTAPVGRIEDHAVAGLQGRTRMRPGGLDSHRSVGARHLPISTPRWRGARPWTTA
jgi:hypothetical protein